jgi:tRNA pseudouridine13 synthase
MTEEGGEQAAEDRGSRIEDRAFDDELATSVERFDGEARLGFDVPYLTAELPGISGTIKAIPEDFEVEEIPAYEPSGAGDQLFLWIQKRGVAAEELTRHIARALEIHTGDVGVAGLKDRQAVTRQWISVPRSAESRVTAINSADIRVLDARPHTQKLRTGHLRGNRFRILIRDVPPDAVARVQPIREMLERSGLPNFFGEQRFGRDRETAALGLGLLRGDRTPLPGHWSRKRFLRKLALSAGQAVLFNRYLARRMADGLLHTVLDGDVMFKLRKGDRSNLCEAPFGPFRQIGPVPFSERAIHDTDRGGIFYVTDRAAEQLRFDRRETVHAGPIYGSRTFAAHGEAAAREAAILAEAGVNASQLRGFGKLLSGTRRANLVFLVDLNITPLPHGLEFRFTLPAGSYATVLLAEFLKLRGDQQKH